IQFEVDIAELPLGIGDALIQLNGDKRIAGQRYGLNTVVRIRSGMDGLILGGNVLNSTGNVLFDLLRGGSGPWTRRDAETHGNVRVFALRHGGIAEPAPNEHGEEKYPGDVRMLDEKPWNIPAISDVLLVFVCHFFLYLYGRTCTESPSFKPAAPTTTTFSPGFTPSTATSLSWVSPSATWRKCASHFPPSSLATKTA